MKVIVFSDTHLTDIYNHKIYEKLQKIISDADKVIINGDFWEGMKISFDYFLQTEWNKLFPLLKEKKTVYITGNHDYEIDSRTNLFSEECVDKKNMKIGDCDYHFEHGDKIVEISKKSKLLNTILCIFDTYGRKILGLGFYNVGFFLNIKMILWKKKNLDKKTYLICGHSHFRALHKKIKYANSGYTKGEQVQYLEITNNEITLKSI